MAKTETTTKDAAQQQPRQPENPLAKFDPAALKGITTSDQSGPSMALLPRNMVEAMELAKLMAAGRFVPAHLRGNAGDCLAIVMQAIRWDMDPFAVAGQCYFVKDGAPIAYMSQLVVSLINTRAPIRGRLEYEYERNDKNQLVSCTVTGTIVGDPRPKDVTAYMAGIRTQNSPLWKDQPEQQLGYYTARMWARRHVPEVLLGVYTEDEVREAYEAESHEYREVDTTSRPTRTAPAASLPAQEQQRQEPETDRKPADEKPDDATPAWPRDVLSADGDTFATVEDQAGLITQLGILMNGAEDVKTLQMIAQKNPIDDVDQETKDAIAQRYAANVERIGKAKGGKGKPPAGQGGLGV